MHGRITAFLCLLALTPWSAPASANAIVAVDTDVSLSGSQSLGSAIVGDQFSVDILIDIIDLGESLNGFEFDLAFDPTVLSAVSVVAGDFLLSPVFTLQTVLGPDIVEFAQVTVGSGGATGSGTLARVVFEVVGLGSSILDLTTVVLAQPFGVPLNVGEARNAAVAATAVPEPSAALVFAAGVLILHHSVRRQ